MAKSIFVYSTLTCSQAYTPYQMSGGDIPVPQKSILIHGGTNVPNKNLITPQGVMTEITPAEYEQLKDIDLFKLHQENGFITVSERKVDPEVAAADMQQRSDDAPFNENDFASEGDDLDEESLREAPKPTTNAPGKKPAKKSTTKKK